MPPRTNSTFIPCSCSLSQRCQLQSSTRLFFAKNSTTTSPASSSSKDLIPPESPKFISIPKTVQERPPYYPRIRGVLPVPREIFPKKSSKDKTSIEYFQNVIPEPRPKPPGEPIHPAKAYKARQAVYRRQNLRQSLIELEARKRRGDQQQTARSAAKIKTNLRLQKLPPLESERLARPSVPFAMQPLSGKTLPDPDRAERIAEKRARTASKQAEREEKRLRLLHTLYVNAANFITTEAQLKAEIDRAFDDQEQFTNAQVRGENVWNLGRQEKVQQLLDNPAGVQKQGVLNRSGNDVSVMRHRLDRVAEELTGMKL